MAEFVGGFIDEKVITQLFKRSDIYSKKNKTVEDIHFMNSRNTWVRIVSSVNLLDEQGNYTSKPAQNFILSNLVSLKENFKEVTEGGKKINKLDSLSPVLSSGIDFSGRDASKAYNYSTALGVRPRPGITSFSVISKGRFGTIREANVAFSVWSVEDLDAIERLYFAPGYTCVVEWGHTIYVDNNGKIQTDTSEANKSLLDYFNDSKSQQDIAAILKDKTEKTDYNYQSFFGIIKNFSWSFRPDGGYDCSVSIISQGEVLQSLSMNIDNAGPSSQAVAGEGADDQETGIYNKNLIYRFLGDIRKDTFIAKEGNRTEPKKSFYKPLISFKALSPNVLSALENTEGIFEEQKYLDLVDVIDPNEIQKNAKLKFVAIFNDDVGSERTDKLICYFSLRTLLILLNKGFIIKDENCNTIAGFDIKSREQYFTFNKHVSLDPRVCVLPKQIIDDTSKEGKNLIPKQFIELSKVISDQSTIHNKRILDILITDILVEKALESAGDNVFNFINFILAEITSALGELNEFIISENQDTFELEIKDVGVTPSKQESSTSGTGEITIRRSNFTTIPLSGLKSILTDLNIQSKISKDLVSMISVAAQAGPTNTAEDTVAMTRWNEGRKDRFYGDKTQIGCFNSPTNQQTTEPEEGLLLGVVRAVVQFFKRRKGIFQTEEIPLKEQTLYNLIIKGYSSLFTGVDNGKRYLADVFQTAKAKAASLFKTLLYGSAEDITNLTISKGVIPVELSFKTDGIGGLKIGEAFKVSRGVLPTRYDEFGYIITGLDHVIENNRWYTNVKSQLFIIKDQNLEGGSLVVTPEQALAARAEAAVSREDYIEAVPWSAAFISFAVGRVVSNFPRSGAHIGYANFIRSDANGAKKLGWTYLNPRLVLPRVGDIVLYNRINPDGNLNTMRFDTQPWSGNTHGDIVVEVKNDNTIVTVGGNLSQTVRQDVIRLEAVSRARGEQSTVKLPPKYFTILRPPQNFATSIANSAKTEYTLWSNSNWKELTPEAYPTLYKYYVAGNIAALKEFGGKTLTPLPPP